jgi:hypothetical protein
MTVYGDWKQTQSFQYISDLVSPDCRGRSNFSSLRNVRGETTTTKFICVGDLMLRGQLEGRSI